MGSEAAHRHHPARASRCRAPTRVRKIKSRETLTMLRGAGPHRRRDDLATCSSWSSSAATRRSCRGCASKDHPDQPEWLSHVNASVLKVKLATAIIGISSIHLLKTFINARGVHREGAALPDDDPHHVPAVGARDRRRGPHHAAAPAARAATRAARRHAHGTTASPEEHRK